MSDPTKDPSPPPDAYAQRAPAPPTRPLAGDAAVDVVVVGGGITGASAALHLAQDGRSVALIEARELGQGGSGRAFGNVVASHKHDETWLRETYGAAQGERMIDWFASGPRLVFDLIDRYGVACQDRRTGLFYAAHWRGAEAGLRARAEALQARGQDVVYMGEEETAERVGSRFYPGAFWDRRTGSVNPLALTRGLIGAAAGLGVQVFTETPATAIRRDGAGLVVETPQGEIRAGAVAICTNAYSDDLWPGLARSVVPLRGHQLTTAPLGENARAAIFPGGQALIDTRRLFSGVRLFDDGRLHMSVDGPVLGPRANPDLAGAATRVAELFPALGEVAWEETWTGWVAINRALEPRLHELAPGVWTALGYAGRGLALGVLMGREIARRIADRNAPEAVYPVTPMRPMLARALAPLAVGATIRRYARLDARELNARRAEL